MVGKRLGDRTGAGVAATAFEPGRVAEAHAAFLSGDRDVAERLVRGEVLASWERSLRHLSPLIDHAPVLDDAPARWRTGRMARAFDTVADEMVQIANDGDFVAAVTDESGAIVWIAGGRTMRHRAEHVGFLPGGRWDEEAVGTNALGLALTTGVPAAVRATEHFSPMGQDWVCYSAPIVDPATGTRAGVLDLSTTWRRANPLALSTVSALARNIELVLGTQPLPVTRTVLRLDVLGRADALLDGQRLVLPPRQLELLTILALHPGGLSLDEIHDRLHGDHVASTSTTKAELSHLRRAIGAHLGNRPYRLDGNWSSDHTDVLTALRTDRLDDAVTHYRGPLLPRSSAPSIEEHRHAIAMSIRGAVIAEPTPSRLAALINAMPDDPYLVELAQRGH